MRFSGLLGFTRWPSLCALCNGWGHQRLCSACIARFCAPVMRCVRCAIEVPDGTTLCGSCVRQPPPFDGALAAVSYAHPWDGLIARFKFHSALDLAPALTSQLLGAIRRSESPVPQLLVPMPLSAQRLRERGYNQSWELTKRLGASLHCRVDAFLLLRIRDDPHQISLPREERAANVRGAFAVEPTRSAELRGCSVALIDDVMTTCATAGEAASVLLQAGASDVQVWVLGRTPRPEDR